MKATFRPSSRIDKLLPVVIFALTVVLLVGLGGLVAACGGTETTSTVATATTQAVTSTQSATITTQPSTTTQAPTTTTVAPVQMSAAEIGQWKTDATAFADRFYGPWPDPDAASAVVSAEFAEDSTFYDPSSGDFLSFKGKPAIAGMVRGFLSNFPDMKVHRQGVYLSGDGAACFNAVENLWAPWGGPEPADHPPQDSLEVFRFKDGLVTSYDIWLSAQSAEMVSFGAFAPGKGGPEQLQAIADKYLAAWASGDKARIAALYHEDAVFSDTMLGLQAQGPAAIAELLGKRFGSGDTVTFEIVNLYVQTNGYPPPTEDQPELGAIIAVGIHYLCNLVVEGKPATVQGLTTFDLGTLQGTVVLDPNGLITREEVFYDADSLLASGLVH
jgi:hypothetical protein